MMNNLINLNDYKNMINSFRTNDLQALLSNFTQNRGGRKSELRDRALELLRTRTSAAFNHNLYLLKIGEIARRMQSDMPNNIEVVRLRQQETMALGNIEVPPQRMYQPPQYSQQPMQMITRAGLPQVMPQMQRGIYGNSVGANHIQGISMASNNIQYLSSNYQMAAPRAVASQLPTGQQMNVNMTTRPTVASTANSNAYMPSAQILSQIEFKKLPFYDVISVIMKPTFLTESMYGFTLQNAPRGMKESVYKFNLSIDQADAVANAREVVNGKINYPYQYQIRICQLVPGCTEVTDYLPLGLYIRVNTKSILLPPAASNSNSRSGTELRRSPLPINCTHNMKLSPIISNVIIINWLPEKINYFIGFYLVHKLNTDDLIKKLKEKESKNAEETKSMIIKKLADVDPDLATTSYRFSLVCPVGKMRMKIPAKSIHCDHLQCFDAPTFILMNEKKPTWMCPTCNKSCLYDDIQIQNYFLEVVTSPDLKPSIKEIDILADGTWKVYEDKNNALDTKETPPIDTVNLDSDDEDFIASTEDAEPDNSQVQQPKVPFIDLTISNHNNKNPSAAIQQENEALAADNIADVITVELQPQVQPQQAVTSSEQGVVIEIDSPSPPPRPASITEDS